MRYLLDTHTLLWMRTGDTRLDRSRWEPVFSSEENEIFVSVICFWEMVIKHSLGKLKFAGDLATLGRTSVDEQGFQWVTMEINHLLRLEKLPYLHRDPFDRILIAQALELGATAVTDDAQWSHYKVKTAW